MAPRHWFQEITMTLVKRRESTQSLEVRGQWKSPGDILSLLLLVGADVVQHALAQQSGDRLPTPVVFSFGWVAYSFTGLLTVIGQNSLLPKPEIPLDVFSTGSSYVRTNQSWIIGRVIRDFEKHWMPEAVRSALNDMLEQEGRAKAGLCISLFEASEDKVAGYPRRDIYWLSGYLVSILQLGITVIPWVIWGDWLIFVIAAWGTLLAFATGSLPQWRRERWACRKNTNKTFVLTRGNGAQHALVIFGKGRGLDLEDLASSTEISVGKGTRYLYGLFAVMWIVLLITVSGIKENTWFLVAVGALGMVHTVIVAGAARSPEWFGIHLTLIDYIVRPKVMDVLRDAEIKYPGLGRSMLSTFFSGELRPDEDVWWKECKKVELAERQKKTNMNEGDEKAKAPAPSQENQPP